tara:strand:+ start:688 stop:1848 length:1161 start_codon:yes stop_codon:yes gene_type:complete
MGLITETNAQYYSGQQVFSIPTPAVLIFNWTGDTDLTVALSGVSNTNFKVLVNNAPITYVPGVPSGAAEYTLSAANQITIGAGTPGDIVLIQLLQFAIDNNHGNYEYVSLNDIINNFMVAYIGVGKLIPNVKRTDIMFHAKRGLQEFSYDTLRSMKSQELTIPASLSLIIPQDYVNYVNLSWVDKSGVKHIIYPTTLTSNPTDLPIQDTAGVPTQGGTGANLQSEQAEIETRWASNNSSDLTGEINNEIFQDANVYGLGFDRLAYGQRYGLEPEVSQKNGWFTINERTGSFNFSSGLANRLIVLEYISDGLAVDADTRIPKMAEQAMYMHIAYSILSGRINIPEYIVNRFKRDRSSALRNAKIRLSNIKLNEFTQIMRGKSKWIKH